MDYEKKYKEALEKARQLCDYPTTKPFISDLQDIFPELRESKDERIRKAIKYCIKQGFIGCGKIENVTPDECLAWIEKQGKQASAIRWYNTSLTPEEMRELLVEWDSEDATWHEVAFYGATSKTFNVNGKQLEGVTRWCYIDDIVKEQAPKTKWTKEDEAGLGDALWAIERAKTTVKNENEMGNLWYAESWLKSIKQRLEKL